MRESTSATLDQLAHTCWFSKVGQKDTKNPLIVLSSWEEAITHSCSPSWQELQLKASNQYCERLAEHNKERFRLWNNIVREVKLISVPLVTRKMQPFIEIHDFPKTVLDSIQWDILHLCMEAEYADVFPPGFYAAQGYWYSCGHFSCGWKGDFPKGICVIY